MPLLGSLEVIRKLEKTNLPSYEDKSINYICLSTYCKEW